MKEREYLLTLYEIYKNVLSIKEREYFEDYYFEDLSLQEIADNNNVSKSYVSKYINNIESKIINFEQVLNINEKNNKIRKVISKLDKKTKEEIEQIL